MKPKIESSPTRNRQQVAHSLAKYMSNHKINSQAARELARNTPGSYRERRHVRRAAGVYLTDRTTRTLPREDRDQLRTIRWRLKQVADKELAEKQGSRSTLDLTTILLRAKYARLGKDDRREMYTKAGFTSEEIESITPKEFGKTMIGNGIVTVASLGGAAAVVENANTLPVVKTIPSSTWLAIASILPYTLAYLLETDRNLKLTKIKKYSINTSVTILHYLAKRLLPEKTGDWVARATPVVGDLGFRSAASGAIGGITGNARDVVAGYAFGTLFNVGAAGLAKGLSMKGKNDPSPNLETAKPSDPIVTVARRKLPQHHKNDLLVPRPQRPTNQSHYPKR